MGVLLRWDIPTDADVTYNKTYIYRSASKTGTYTLIAIQDITDNTYFDKDGTSSHWYKIRFFDETNSVWSDYSEPIQGGDVYGYCSIEDFRRITGIPSTLVSDSEVVDYIFYATAQFNADVNFKVNRERVEYIDPVRQNRIDGTNTTFYVKYCKEWYIGDMNNDGEVNENDIIVHKVSPNGVTETTVSVSSVDPSEGKFILEEAPESGSRLYVTYMRAPIDEHTPHELVKQAVAYLAGAMACTAISAAKFKQFKIGDLTILSQLEGYVALKERYDAIVHRILRDNTALEVIEG